MAKNEKMNVCMIAYTHLPSDARRMMEAKAVAEEYNVDFICLKTKKEKKYQIIDNINLLRIPIRRRYLGYFFGYGLFILYVMFYLVMANRKKNYLVIHVHNPPDFLIFSTLLIKIFYNPKIILGIHDPLPEITASRLDISQTNVIIKFMNFLEKTCINLSDHAITVNDVIKDNFISKNIPPEKITVVFNSADEDLFNSKNKMTPKKEFGLSDKFVVLYQGTVMKRRGLQTLIQAANILKNKIPNLHVVIIGDGDYLDEISCLIKNLGLESYVFLGGKKPVQEVPKYVAVSDVCVIPFTRAPINQIGSPNKLFEYTAYSKPMVLSNHKAMKTIFSEKEAFYFEPENYHDLADKIYYIFKNPQEAMKKTRKAKKRYDLQYKWSKMRTTIKQIYSNFLISTEHS